jgi:hypothetical protein
LIYLDACLVIHIVERHLRWDDDRLTRASHGLARTIMPAA